MRKVLFIILSGFGEGKNDFTNPVYLAKKPFFDYIKKHYPVFLLQASGILVGLPWNEPGNSEAGHLTIGTGKIYYKNYPKISLAIKNETFFQNPVLKSLLEHAKKYNSRIHLVGLLSKSKNHSAKEHILALLNFFKNNNFYNVFLHLFLDGIDSPPQSGLELLKELERELNNLGIGKIASLCGRTYGMDESRNWQIKTQTAFLLISEGKGRKTNDYKEYIERIYNQDKNFSDENLEPLLIDEEGILKNNDGIFFFNFREDGMYQLAKSFLDPNFKEFERPQKSNLFIASMTKYLPEIEYPVAFPPDKIKNSLSRIISENNLKQLKIIEEKKAKNLTVYFNGYVDKPYPNEFWKIVDNYDGPVSENPLLQSELITDLTIQAIKENFYDIIISEYIAPDIIGHHGDFSLSVRTVEGLDNLLNKIYNFLKDKKEWVLLITSDHGNLELGINLLTGEIHTAHTTNPVPFYIINEELYIENKSREMLNKENKIRGSLIDIAPTILSLMGIPIPKDLEGVNLLNKI